MVAMGSWECASKGCFFIWLQLVEEGLLPTVNSDRFPGASESPGTGPFQSDLTHLPLPVSFFVVLEGTAFPGCGHGLC